MGEGISEQSKEKIKMIAEQDQAVLKVMHIISVYEAPDEILLMLIVAFKDDLDTQEINESIDRLRFAIKEEFKAQYTAEQLAEIGGFISVYFSDVKKKAVRDVMLNEGKRLDGRKFDEIRPIWAR